ncbi:TetR/AcrR family transcriptional regulator [Hyphomicrobium sp.]|uniref:TetR/AcrR family transcriptional regulator n=1 Tax=Hyphomicrobium sp. TaxID=82 RepID=UPI003F723D6E
MRAKLRLHCAARQDLTSYFEGEGELMSNRKSKDAARSVRVASAARKAALAPAAAERPKGREAEFLKAALNLFAESNFASVTIKDIAQSLGVNTALIYYYFENKTDLFRAAIDFALENAFANMRAIEGGSADPADLISAWLDNHVERYAEIHHFVKIALDYKGSSERDPAVDATIASFYAKERELLSRFIRLGIDQGRFKRVDPGRMAQFISTHLDGCMVRMVILPDFPLKAAVGDLHRFVLDHLESEAQPKTTRKTRR